MSKEMTEKFAKYIDHTLLKPEATPEQIDTLCDEAIKYGFKSVCISPCHIVRAEKKLAGSNVAISAVVGFPHGAETTGTKAYETADAVSLGASEIDMVINIGAAKAGDWALVRQDIEAVVKAAGKALVKVIIEACLLTDEEKVKACIAAKNAGAAFVKTSTGFSTGGATVQDVRLMRKTVGPEMGVKAAGGIRDYKTAAAMVEAGANRLGTSAGVSIVSGVLNGEYKDY